MATDRRRGFRASRLGRYGVGLVVLAVCVPVLLGREPLGAGVGGEAWLAPGARSTPRSSACLAASPPASAGTPSATPSALGQGDSFALGSWTVVVDGSESREDVPEFGGMSAGGVFLVVRLTVTNGGCEPAAFPYAAMRLADGQGRRHALDPHATEFHLRTDGAETADDTDERLVPGAMVNTVLVFDVPAAASRFVLEAVDGRVTVTLDR